jgi:hypothetical protein
VEERVLGYWVENWEMWEFYRGKSVDDWMVGWICFW